MRTIKGFAIVTLLSLLLVTLVPTLAAWGAGWRTGSVIGSGTVTGLKNAKKNGATVIATVGGYGSTVVNGQFVNQGNMPGVVWCGNPGANTFVVPGVNPVTLTSNFSGSQLVAPDAIDKNGKAPFSVHAAVSSATLNAVFNASALCPGGNNQQPTNWTLVDFVPQQFTGLLQGFDSTGALLTQSVYDCQIPWAVLNTLAYQQQSAYTCTERLDQRVN